jgi:hypothetical protein
MKTANQTLENARNVVRRAIATPTGVPDYISAESMAEAGEAFDALLAKMKGRGAFPEGRAVQSPASLRRAGAAQAWDGRVPGSVDAVDRAFARTANAAFHTVRKAVGA